MPEIFTYHNISNNYQDEWATTPLIFRLDMEWLAKKGYKGISLREFYKDIKQEKVFVLTFDDGYKDFFTTAMPILNKLNFSATIFIVSKLVGDINYWQKRELQSELLNWEEIRKIIDMGYEIGSHGLYHDDFFRLSQEELEKEIAGSKKLIESIIDELVVSFSYPWNRCNEQIIEIVKKAGYKYAAIHKRVCRNDFETNQFQLARRSMSNRNSVKRFIK